MAVGSTWLAGSMLAVGLLAACAPELTVGAWTCTGDRAEVEEPDLGDPIAVPWESGFEARFCDYTQLAGFCYTEPSASYSLVTSPVHSGRYAAAFRVDSSQSDGKQARCVRQGAQPVDAFYSVWFLLPRTATNDAVWNLVHFQGGTPTGQHGLWDISLLNGRDGRLEAFVYDFLNGEIYRAPTPVPVPIGAWFQFEFHLKRAADATGTVALYQDGLLLFEKKGLITDDSSWGQWYVGNFATGLTPSDFTLYVDDVAIRSTR